MKQSFRPSLRLKPSILSLFALLTVPVLAVIIVVNYVANDRIARLKGQELVERFRREAMDSVRDIFEPIKSMVRVAAALGEQQGEFYADNRSMKYFEAILQHSPKIVSAYAGLNDGQFRQTRRLTPEAVLFGKQVPPGTRLSYHWLEYPGGSRGAIDHN